jgi:hypothetical protein
MKDARLLPSAEDLEMIRYEPGLARQFKSQPQHLVGWRRRRRAKLTKVRLCKLSTKIAKTTKRSHYLIENTGRVFHRPSNQTCSPRPGSEKLSSPFEVAYGRFGEPGRGNLQPSFESYRRKAKSADSKDAAVLQMRFLAEV